MSKGHGKLQRRLLDILNAEARPFETFELAARTFDVPLEGPIAAAQPKDFDLMRQLVELQGVEGLTLVTPAQVVAVRRALQKLADEGVVFDLGYGGRRKFWANEHVGLRFKIRMMQEENAALRDNGSMDIEAFKRRADEMAPLLKRAEKLGVDYTSGWG